MAKAKKKAKEEVIVPDDFHIVIYTDGGCQPNPGFAGYGVHGYSYRETGVNLSKFRLTKRATTKGYGADTDPEKDRVFALDVLSASGVVEFGQRTTNNVAELTALTTGLTLACQYTPEDGKGKLLSIHVLSDSEYTLKALDIITRARDKTKRAEMLRRPLSNGQPRKNVPQTLQLLAAIEGCEAAGITSITHKWIKGHDGLAGNEEADTLATRAVQINMQANSRSSRIFKSETLKHAKWINARSFWRSKHEAIPLVDHNNVVFSNIAHEAVSGLTKALMICLTSIYFLPKRMNCGLRRSHRQVPMVRMRRPRKKTMTALSH
jgi:ribonuclease HI